MGLASTCFSSRMSGTDMALSDVTDTFRKGSSSIVDVGSSMVGMVDAAVVGRGAFELSSPPGLLPSSAASWIQLSFWWREEPEDDELEGAAVCRAQAEARAASLSSSGVVMDRAMS